MNTRILTLVAGIALLATTFAPVAEAQSGLNVRSVGEIFVDATGRASGQNLNGLIVEASGLITQYKSTSLDAKLFESVQIDGFSQAQKIQGVGSSEIVLRGSNAVISLTDNIQGTLRIQATADTTVTYRLSQGVNAVAVGEANHRLDVLAENGAYLGSLVIAGARGQATAASGFSAAATGEVKAHLEKGSQVVFNARPIYIEGRSYSDAAASALAEGWLAANVVSEFSHSTEAKSETNYNADVQATTYLDAAASVTTEVRSRAQASAMVAYDLAYESLPARSASDVTVYVDGQVAKRVASAGEVKAAAAASTAAYYAMTAGGRTQVLASTPSFATESIHRITVSASGKASSETQAASESRATASSSIYGELAYYANGKLTGEFLTGIVSSSDASVHDYTSIATGTEIFDSFQVSGDSYGDVNANGKAVTLTGAKADLTMVDDAYATLLVSAKQQSSIVFNLGANVKAYAESAKVVRLEGPNGYVGWMAAASASAAASADANAATQIVTSAEGQVTAVLDSGSRLVLLSESRGSSSASASGGASGEAIAKAIANGQIAGHVLAGYEGGAAAATSTEYATNVVLSATAEAKGSFDVQFQSAARAVFLFESRGTALAAKSASDVQVLVDGKAATATSSVQAVLSASTSAKYYVDTTLEGQVRVLVNTGLAAAQGADVSIVSRLESAAQARANTDAFGTFKMFADGLAVGSFVSLQTDQRAGVVNHLNMLSTGTEVFTSVAAGASAFVSSGADGASTLHLENREVSMEFSDTTNAYMKTVAKTETDVRYRLGAAVEATLTSASVLELSSADGAWLGTMIITNAEGRAAANSQFVAEGQEQIRAHLEQGAQVIFKTHVGIETELSAAERALMNQAIAAGHVGGQVFVQTQASLSANAYAALAAQAAAEGAANGVLASAAEAEGRVTAAITASYYNDVQIVTAAVQNRVDVTVSSTLSMGKTIIVSLDRNTIAGMITGDAEILVDGHASAQADSYADILNPNDDGGVYEYFVLAGEAGTQVLVSIPHFSTHTVTLKEREASTPPVFMYATIFLGVLVAVETVVLVRRRMA